MRRLRRVDIRDMSDTEWYKYKETFLKAKSQGFLDEISALHVDLSDYCHYSQRFLPWHRMLLLYFEEILQAIAVEDITIPYWDWSRDGANSRSGFIFSEKYWGCEYYNVEYPAPHLLKRNREIDTFYSATHIKRLLKKKMNYDDFSNVLEIVPHAIVHLNIGGDMEELYSPNDPLFWHHHSYVDYLWDQKKLLNKKYSSSLSKNEVLVPFNKKVSSVLGANRHIKYVPSKGVHINALGSKSVSFEAIKENPSVLNTANVNPRPIPIEYIKRHCYKESKVRECEY